MGGGGVEKQILNEDAHGNKEKTKTTKAKTKAWSPSIFTS